MSVPSRMGSSKTKGGRPDIFEVTRHVLDLLKGHCLFPILGRGRILDKGLGRNLVSQLGEVCVPSAVPFQGVGVGARDGGEVTSCPGRGSALTRRGFPREKGQSPWRGIVRRGIARQMLRDDGDVRAEALLGEHQGNIKPDDPCTGEREIG